MLGICVGGCGCVTLCESARPTTPRSEPQGSGEYGGRKTIRWQVISYFLTFHSLCAAHLCGVVVAGGVVVV